MASPPDSGSYTTEQLEAVDRVIKCEDYYEVLEVTKEATETDLKKSYRKLALLLHPDKNGAPGADEAFKAVGNAFAVLSDAGRRELYDEYGPEEAREQGSSGRSSRGSYGYYDSDDYMSAEELFDMFFGFSGFTSFSFGGGGRRSHTYSSWWGSEPTLPRRQEEREAEAEPKAPRTRLEGEDGKVGDNGKCWKHQRFGQKARECAAPDLCKMKNSKPKAKRSARR